MATLTPTTILQKTLGAFTTLFPMLGRMGTDFDDAPIALGDTVIAHIQTLPTAASYDGTTGYANGATESRDLIVDLPIVCDSHQHVPVKASHLYAIADKKEEFTKAVGNQAFVLGKTMIGSVLAKCKSSNLSFSQTATTANSDLDVIEQITTDMNTNEANPLGRVGLINSAVAQTLALDSRIGSKDYYGQLTGAKGGLRAFYGVGGFEALYEYPALGSNNAASQTFTAAVTDICTATAHGFSTGDRVRVSSGTTLPAGLAADTTYYIIKLTADTFKLASSDANATAGTAVNVTDTGTGTHSIVGYENITGIFFEASAIAIRAGIPSQTSQLAAALGIPQVMLMESLRDPISGFSLALMKWQVAGKGDLYLSPTAIWGSAVGRQAGAAAAITDRAAVLLRSA